ncbi:MAG: hypothetical protein KKA65_00470 [Nanoarchaeota archaeon]|nr:hypothetical protein [Nanoarchaeota archaeon]MBU4352767.1 hypothetical protein [Nanoarchaeota archaeon]MBU4455953.1 hypothetical protein [Nanoarchaeota archaeon]MCG2720089.1 hypothetical protein [Nanoarchaeota archaeon]
MNKYITKSIIIGRKKGTKDKPDVRPCFISLFDKNNPHKSAQIPFEILEFEEIHKIVIKGLDINYLLPGNDIIINNLEHIELKIESPHIFLTGKQLKNK